MSIRGEQLNSKKIEEKAVHYVHSIVLNNPFLEDYLSFNDKEPSWDGSIHVHTDDTGNKRSILGKVPVQIKGTTNFDFKSKTFPIEVPDLMNYLEDGGALYLVVALEKEHHQIFYKQLLPLDIKNIIANKETQKTIRVKLNAFPSDNSEVLNIFKDFLSAKIKQASFANVEPMNLEQAFETIEEGELAIEFSGNSYLDIFDKAKKGEVRTYFNSPVFPIPIPIINRIENLAIYEKEKTNVIVNDFTFFKEVTRERTDIDEVALLFGKSFKLTIDSKRNRGQLKISMTKVLSDITLDYHFFIEFLKSKSINIFGYSINFKDEILNIDLLSQVEDTYDNLSTVVTLWRKLKLSLDFDLDQLTDVQENNLIVLARSIVKKESVRLKETNENDMYIFKFGEVYLLFYALYEDDGYIFYDFFDVEDLKLASYDWQRICGFFDISLETILKLKNVDIENIFAICKRQYEKQSFQRIELILLKVINYADLIKDTTERENILESCLKFSEWIIANEIITESDYIMLLNVYQIKYRLSLLNDEDFQELIKLLNDNSVDSIIKFAAAVLIDNEPLARNHLMGIDIVYMEELKGFPIYHLYTELQK